MEGSSRCPRAAGHAVRFSTALPEGGRAAVRTSEPAAARSGLEAVISRIIQILLINGSICVAVITQSTLPAANSSRVTDDAPPRAILNQPRHRRPLGPRRRPARGGRAAGPLGAAAAPA